jgi:hypothetical protein
MRPLFAIAPLAIVLALIGPTAPEASEVLAAAKAWFLSYQSAPQQGLTPDSAPHHQLSR